MITILQIGYDKLLLQARAYLLGRQGYRVVSVVGNGSGFTAASNEGIDIILIGHSAPIGIRENVANILKDHFPEVPVVALRSSFLQKCLQHADYNGSVDRPEEWLGLIAKAASPQLHR